MSTTIAKNYQVGSDSTATNNFTIRQPATPDGTVRIANGNSGTTTDLVTVTSAGNVGVGTTSPSVKLDVVGTTTSGIRLRSNSGASNGFNIYNDSSTDTAYLTNFYSGPMVFGTNNTERARIDSSGNLGIGTSSPGYKLDVNTTGGSAATARLNGNDQANVRLRLENGGSGGRTWELVGGLPGANNSNFSLYDVTGTATRLTIDSSGNLGLGVTPSAWNSSSRVVQFGNNGTASFENYAGLTNNMYYNGYRDSSNVARYASTDRAARFGTSTNGGFNWEMAPSGTAGNTISFTTAMTLTSAGKLVVGGTVDYGLITASGGTFALVTNTASQRRLSFWSTANGDSENAYIQVQNDGATTNTGEMLFATKNSGGTLAERARITSGGDLLVNRTSTLGSAKFVVEADTTTANPMTVSNSRSTTATDYSILFYRNASLVGSVQTSLTATSYVTSSDYRLKENIQPMTGALAKVAALKPVTYKWKATGGEADGFIAHELAEVCPQAVTGEKDAVDADGNPKYQGIDTSFLVATLTAALQELKAELDSVKTELALLKGTA